ncbi:hypothetical protein GCM10010121_061820 [Streptomyces brasiliensis]|uniref:Transposase n=1 Tax=Streptomyces brasiliensis TaxID=1954 RepID=A0A917L636_9ACTN|nr:hypothetical protein GCM10010121_061820 [Streptomyces brasiliensis]
MTPSHRKPDRRSARPSLCATFQTWTPTSSLYAERNTVERCINRLRNWRGIAFRFDKTPASYEAGLYLCGAMLWLRSITPHS